MICTLFNSYADMHMIGKYGKCDKLQEVLVYGMIGRYAQRYHPTCMCTCHSTAWLGHGVVNFTSGWLCVYCSAGKHVDSTDFVSRCVGKGSCDVRFLAVRWLFHQEVLFFVFPISFEYWSVCVANRCLPASGTCLATKPCPLQRHDTNTPGLIVAFCVEVCPYMLIFG